MLAADPEYINNLYLVGSAQLVQAWLDGDWNAVEGAFFDGWSVRNVVSPFEIPDDWLRFRWMDWGFASPFSVGWWAVVGDDILVPDRHGVASGSAFRVARLSAIANGTARTGRQTSASG